MTAEQPTLTILELEGMSEDSVEEEAIFAAPPAHPYRINFIRAGLGPGGNTAVQPLSNLSDELCASVDGLMVFRHYLTREDIKRFTKLKVVVRMGVGYDRLDRVALAERGVTVCNVPDYGTEEIADHALALALSLRRGLVLNHELQRASPPAPWTVKLTPLVSRIRGSTFGILGLGRIGTAAALRAKAFGWNVIFFDPYLPNGADKALGVERVRDIKDLFRRSTTLSIHCPCTSETRGMVNKELLDLLPAGAILVNTARGEVVCLDAIEDALKTGRLVGAGLDVLPVEPIPEPAHPLLVAYREKAAWLEGRLIVTPHSAFFSPESFENIRTYSADTIRNNLIVCMASANSLLHAFQARRQRTGSPTEYRQLVPICTALEVNSYKNVIQLCTKLIKKQPNFYVVYVRPPGRARLDSSRLFRDPSLTHPPSEPLLLQALKTLALFLSSRPVPPSVKQEILAVVEFVKTNANGAGLADPDVLVFFAWVLKGMDQGDATLALFAKATQSHPENEEVCIEAFLHYVRVAERKSAQQIAMRMQRTFKKEPYLWWFVESILLQVSDSTDPSNNLLLSLAERQITSHYAQLRSTAGLPASLPTLKKGSAAQPLEIDAPKAPGRDKGKGKDVGASGAETPPTPPTESPKGPKALEFSSTHEFHLITRFLELRVVQEEANAAALAPATSNAVAVIPAAPKQPPPPTVLPSLPTDGVPVSLKDTLLAHFASPDANKWCERGLGLELWRREVELKYGSVDGGEWVASWNRLKHSLEQGDTNWHTMLFLIRLTFSIALGSSEMYRGAPLPSPCPEPSGVGATLLQQSRVLFRGLADEGEKGLRERGFLLALLEIEKESRTRNWEEGTPLSQLVAEYFERFSTKMCCLEDLKPYLAVLTPSERAAFRETVVAIADGTTDLSDKKIWRVITASQIARSLLAESDEATEVAAALAYTKRYFQALPLGKGLVATELQPADDFALLAGQAFVSAWEFSHDRAHLEKAIAVLDFAAARSRYKYQIRILLVHLLRLLGASSLAVLHYRILGVKSIQYDTLSHVLLTRAATFAIGNDPGLAEETAASQKWYTTGEHEASEMVIRAFNFKNYTKIEDFAIFQNRLSRSLSKYTLAMEAVRMQVVKGVFDPVAGARTVEALARTLKSGGPFSDNRDYKTLPSLQPSSQRSIREQTQMGPRPGTDWLRAMSTTYANFLVASSGAEEAEVVVDDVATPELTPSESALLTFSVLARKALSAGLEASEAEEAALAFFKEQEARFTAASEDVATLPWELLHIAEITLEGFCLFDLAVDEKIAEITQAKIADHAKISKGLRTLRTSARELLRGLGSRVNTYAKQFSKQRAKTQTNISSLTEFPLLDADHLLSFSHTLVESRKSTAEALGSAIHKRCSK
ncbi:hypothetical protein RQP46_009661 [Phenoliferia psychrophenolica]